MAWSLQLGCKLPKELGYKVDSLGSKICFDSNELDLGSGPRVGGKDAKEILMAQLGVGLKSQQQVSIVAPTSSDRRLAAAFCISH